MGRIGFFRLASAHQNPMYLSFSPKAAALSAVLTLMTFFLIGLAKGYALKMPMIPAAFQTFFTGGAAAGLAYFIGYWLRQVYQI